MNPIVSGGVQPNPITNPSNPVNQQQASTTRQKTNFPQSFLHTYSKRFGEIKPCCAFYTVPNDDFIVRRQSTINSYTLNAPVQNKITRKYGYAAVPMQSILYNTWTKVFVNPKKGDDVDFDNVNTLLNFFKLFQYCRSGFGTFTIDPDDPDQGYIWKALRLMCIMNEILSPSSLMAELGISPVGITQNVIDNDNTFIIEYYVSGEKYQASSVLEILYNFITADDSVDYTVDIVDAAGVSHELNLADPDDFDLLFTLVRDISVGEFNLITRQNSLSSFVTALNSAIAAFGDLVFIGFDLINTLLNISPLVAYHLMCAQFFTNDDVDDVYTAELFRQNMESLVLMCNSNQVYTFQYNGISVIYDWCSAFVLNQMIDFISSADDNAIEFWSNILFPWKALRYGDMMNCARTQPLAVGDVTAPVTANSVSAVDTTVATLKQKFLNLVNSVRNTVRGYSLAVFGVAPDDLPSEPRYISDSGFEIKPSLNVNTASEQGTQQANFTGIGSSTEFSIHVNQNSVVVGVCWEEVQQAYPLIRTPFAFHKDRFDDYLPQLQNIGDQPVKSAVINGISSVDDPELPYDTTFGYLSNNYEYKQMLSYATGATIKAKDLLPGWFLPYVQIPKQITPYSIRYYSNEIDPLYKSLTHVGWERFHFICSDFYSIEASRPMEYVSGILMNS